MYVAVAVAPQDLGKVERALESFIQLHERGGRANLLQHEHTGTQLVDRANQTGKRPIGLGPVSFSKQVVGVVGGQTHA